ncbi:MAG: Rrf2 family transcriptional regulator, partial [Bacteroidales bacterium]|nr:Rrf2 family transcriptional regulator [Bacteroidales bacterium]
EEITVYDVYTAFEPIVIVDCINDMGFCDRSRNCVSRDYWIEFKNEYKEMLSRKTIAQIIERNDK